MHRNEQRRHRHRWRGPETSSVELGEQTGTAIADASGGNNNVFSSAEADILSSNPRRGFAVNVRQL